MSVTGGFDLFSRSVRQLFVNGQRRMISNTGVMQYEKFGDGLSLDEAMDTGREDLH